MKKNDKDSFYEWLRDASDRLTEHRVNLDEESEGMTAEEIAEEKNALFDIQNRIEILKIEQLGYSNTQDMAEEAINFTKWIN